MPITTQNINFDRDEFDENQFYFENDPDTYQTLFDHDQDQIDEYEDTIQKIVEDTKPKRKPKKRGRPKGVARKYNGIYEIIDNTTRLQWSTVTSFTAAPFMIARSTTKAKWLMVAPSLPANSLNPITKPEECKGPSLITAPP